MLAEEERYVKAVQKFDKPSANKKDSFSWIVAGLLWVCTWLALALVVLALVGE
jgi:hypothetical protein